MGGMTTVILLSRVTHTLASRATLYQRVIMSVYHLLLNDPSELMLQGASLQLYRGIKGTRRRDKYPFIKPSFS